MTLNVDIGILASESNIYKLKTIGIDIKQQQQNHSETLLLRSLQPEVRTGSIRL
jgi:hypothetical protein